MKKLLALLLVLAMIFTFATVFTACNDGNYSYSEEDDDDDDDDDDGGKKDPGKNHVVPGNGAMPVADFVTPDCYTEYGAVNNNVVIESDLVKFTLHALEDDSMDDVVLSYTIENNAAGNISFGIRAAAVNGNADAGGIFREYVDLNSSYSSRTYLYSVDSAANVDALFLLVFIGSHYEGDEWVEEKQELVAFYPNGKDAYEPKLPEFSSVVTLHNDANQYAAVTYWGKDEWDEENYAELIYVNYAASVVDINTSVQAVNGLAVDFGVFPRLLPGTFCTDYIYLDAEELSDYGIEEVTQIDGVIACEDAQYNELWAERKTLYPKGEDQAQPYVYQPNGAPVIYESDLCTIYYDHMYLDNWGDPTFMLFMDSTPGMPYNIEVSVTKVNGMAPADDSDAFGYISPLGDCSQYDSFMRGYIGQSKVEELNITDITSVEFRIAVHEEQSWDVLADLFVTIDI